MEIPSRELQERVFGYYTEELPPEGSVKAKVYAAVNEDLTDEQIEILAQTFKRMSDVIKEKVIKRIIEKKVSGN
ncbi:MAG TPA: hypothetical protein VF556_04805 [Pyrinomonadaceae bacterium]|jgi:hypothetical protein